MSDALPLIDIDALVQPVGRATIFGRAHNVFPINGIAFTLVMALEEGDGKGARESLDISRRIIAECVPTLDEQDRDRLNVRQMTAIVAISMQQMTKVQQMIVVAEGKGSAPARGAKKTRRAKAR